MDYLTVSLGDEAALVLPWQTQVCLLITHEGVIVVENDETRIARDLYWSAIDAATKMNAFMTWTMVSALFPDSS